MKRIYPVILLMIAAVVMITGFAHSQEKKEAGTDRLSSEQLDKEGRDLDAQILDLCKKIESVVSRYELMKNRDIRILPYQVSYKLTDSFIEIEKHDLERDMVLKKISRLKTKTIRLYSSGQNLSKIENIIYDKSYNAGLVMKVTIVDNSPVTAGTEDIIFTQEVNGRPSIDGKKMVEIKNTTAFPVRNDLKRDFLIPHLSYFYSVILNIAETHRKSIKDSDSMMFEFLKKSTQY